MNEQLTPDTQRRIQVLQRYMLAMERGDADSVATVLREAEQDRALERMILEVNDFYQQEDHTLVEPGDVAQIQQLLLQAIPPLRTEGVHAPTQDGKVSTVYPVPQTNANRDSEPIEALGATKQQAFKTMPARKAPIQVLPAKKIASQKWYRSRRNWLVAAIAAILVALLLLPNSAAFANQLLSLFNVQQFQPVQV